MTTGILEENLTKVRNFFIDHVQTTGNVEATLTNQELATACDVSMMTARKAVSILRKLGEIKTVKSETRRVATTYVYKGNPELFLQRGVVESQLQYLLNKTHTLEHEKQILLAALQKHGIKNPLKKTTQLL